ncbi:MAG TPA: pyridoxal-phosphate dependent enzyme, partial [Burkholderiales bacterium]|nr:pyridoxal-phosphate dependent enzyme [Burkholderiales bacterium]
MKKTDYLERILNARVYDVAIETPLERAPNLTQRLGNTVLLKREDMQPVFSFKVRGAYNKMAQLTPAALRRGVITASAG